MLQSIKYIVCATALREAYVTVHSYSHSGAVHISLVSYEHLAEVVGLTCMLQNLAFEVAECRVSPARTAAVLVLDACNRILFHYCEYRLVLCNSCRISC